jgi:hypothetical protein
MRRSSVLLAFVLTTCVFAQQDLPLSEETSLPEVEEITPSPAAIADTAAAEDLRDGPEKIQSALRGGAESQPPVDAPAPEASPATPATGDGPTVEEPSAVSDAREFRSAAATASDATSVPDALLADGDEPTGGEDDSGGEDYEKLLENSEADSQADDAHERDGEDESLGSTEEGEEEDILESAARTGEYKAGPGREPAFLTPTGNRDDIHADTVGGGKSQEGGKGPRGLYGRRKDHKGGKGGRSSEIGKGSKVGKGGKVGKGSNGHKGGKVGKGRTSRKGRKGRKGRQDRKARCAASLRKEYLAAKEAYLAAERKCLTQRCHELARRAVLEYKNGKSGRAGVGGSPSGAARGYGGRKAGSQNGPSDTPRGRRSDSTPIVDPPRSYPRPTPYPHQTTSSEPSYVVSADDVVKR